MNEDYRTISLTQGKVALVDAKDFEWLGQWKWHASYTRSGFYACRNHPMLNGRRSGPIIKMHRVILGLEPGDKRHGDHANRDTLDNRRLNLRIATHAQNMWNQTTPRHNSSGFKGVYWHKKRGLWMARLGVNGKIVFLGYRDSAEAAYNELYVPAVLSHHREFARAK